MDIVFRCLFPFAIFFNQSTVDATPWHWPNNVEHTNGIDHHFFLSPFFFFRFSSFFSGFESLLLLFLFINISLRQGEWEEEFVSSGCEINFEHWNGTVFRCFFFFFFLGRVSGRLDGWSVGWSAAALYPVYVFYLMVFLRSGKQALSSAVSCQSLKDLMAKFTFGLRAQHIFSASQRIFVYLFIDTMVWQTVSVFAMETLGRSCCLLAQAAVEWAERERRKK